MAAGARTRLQAALPQLSERRANGWDADPRFDWERHLLERNNRVVADSARAMRYYKVQQRALEIRENREREEARRVQEARWAAEEAERQRTAERRAQDYRDAAEQIDRELARREAAESAQAAYQRAQREEAKRLDAARRAAERSD